MKLLSPAISALARLRLPQIENWMGYPIETQREVLQHLVTSAQYTQFGKQYGFSDLFNVREFKKRVPVYEYDNLNPFIQKMLQGEENILWNTPVNWFAKSSGTTSDKSKFIPISEEILQYNHYQASKDVLTLYYKNFPFSDLLTGKGLVVGGSHQISRVNDEIQYGDLSAVLMQNSPFWGQWLRTPELSIALMDAWETKIEKLAQATAEENVTSLAGVPTWTLLLLKRILDIKGKSNISEVWPNLELYIHGGVSFIPYREQFEKIIGKPINYLEIYNASEGFFAAQDEPGNEGMLLFTGHGIFYEFMPVSEYGKADPNTIGLRDVSLNENYAIVISTAGGLWRYLVGDTIQFTSLNPFRIKITGRIRHYMNAFGEEVMVENADKAIALASADCAAVISDYTAAPVFYKEDGVGAHEWLVEFEKMPESGAEVFTEKLDLYLQQVNSDYEAKRQKNIALKKPVLHVLPHGTFNAWLKSKGKIGGQHKVPRLSNDRNTLEEIKSFSSIQ